MGCAFRYAMTANAFEEDRTKVLDGFVSKPAEKNKLFEALAGILQ